MKSNINKLFLKNLPKDYSIDKLVQLIKLKTGCSPNIEIIQNKKNPNNGLARLAPFSKENEITIKQRLSNNFDFENRRISIDIYDKQKKENKKKNFLKQKKNKKKFDEYTSVFDEQEQNKSEDFHNQNKNFSEKQKQKNEKEKKIEKESKQEKRKNNKNNKKNKKNKQNEKKQQKTTKIARTGSTPNHKNPQNNDYSSIPKNEKNLINDQKNFFSNELQNHQQFTIFMHNISYQANYEKISLLLKKYIQFSKLTLFYDKYDRFKGTAKVILNTEENYTKLMDCSGKLYLYHRTLFFKKFVDYRRDAHKNKSVPTKQTQSISQNLNKNRNNNWFEENFLVNQENTPPNISNKFNNNVNNNNNQSQNNIGYLDKENENKKYQIIK
ncbi:hypothetical protein M0813_28185 [Anaeramoeba flamelloides]|uniref:RRM domain-containing protein n=1 Tax=Anaeramoeba flamelloides TaxID=1746091 RepID=A0ABQ8XTH4_9EUKA|nr:hypothetical protein M0813_28185 [Anaeramoeba flamelloides]